MIDISNISKDNLGKAEDIFDKWFFYHSGNIDSIAATVFYDCATVISFIRVSGGRWMDNAMTGIVRTIQNYKPDFTYRLTGNRRHDIDELVNAFYWLGAYSRAMGDDIGYHASQDMIDLLHIIKRDNRQDMEEWLENNNMELEFVTRESEM